MVRKTIGCVGFDTVELLEFLGSQGMAVFEVWTNKREHGIFVSNRFDVKDQAESYAAEQLKKLISN